MTEPKKFKETQLPPIKSFRDTLRDEDLKEEDYQRAQETWSRFGCKTLKDYHDHYLKTDVLLLADVFEHFRWTTCATQIRLLAFCHSSLPRLGHGVKTHRCKIGSHNKSPRIPHDRKQYARRNRHHFQEVCLCQQSSLGRFRPLERKQMHHITRCQFPVCHGPVRTAAGRKISFPIGRGGGGIRLRDDRTRWPDRLHHPVRSGVSRPPPRHP